ncbi:MAG: GPR endopeptidase [Ruminococcaceae bacterium]|nr:GPR endopeptidase [Oscillospiraceae bacterium]
MYEIRTDLALESHEIASKNKKSAIDGVIFNEESVYNYKLTRIEIVSQDGENATGKPIGKYLSLDVGKIWNRGADEVQTVCKLLGDMINELSNGATSVLVAGLGNTDITADALGPMALSHVLVTRHLKNEEPQMFYDMNFSEISALSPGVLSQTGIETMECIKSVAEKIKPSIVIAIDALASGDVRRLGSVIQISNAGISPGSGVGNRRSALNKSTLGFPVISIGIPTVVDAISLSTSISKLGQDVKIPDDITNEYKNMFVTPKDCDKIISFMSQLIGYSINTAFHRDLSFDDMISILS